MYVFLKLAHIKQQKGGVMMTQLTTLEVEHLRHLIGGHGMIVKKLNSYAESCSDPTLKTLLENDANAASQAQQTLLSFLG